MCDNMMADAGLKTQPTMFRKCLAKLPPQYFRHVKHLATASPLPNDCYDRLKDCLLRRLQLTPAAKWQRLKQLRPCSETRPPSEVYSDLEALYPEAVSSTDTGNEILRERFLECLPDSLQLLCREWLLSHSLADVSLRADAHFHSRSERSVTMLEAASSEGHGLQEQTVAAVRQSMPPRRRDNRFSQDRSRPQNRRSEHSSGAFVDRWCHFHRRFGHEARKCVEPCTFRADMASGNGNGNRQ
jgi:hypothetical protein